jgi:predicted PurR-regulated permease PerM
MFEEGQGGITGHEVLERRSFLLLLTAVTLVFVYLLTPFFGAIFWACVIALLFHRLYTRLLKPLGPNLAALTTLAISVAIAVLPALFVLGSVLQEGANLYLRLQSGELDFGGYLERIRAAFPVVQEFLDRFGLDIGALRDQLSGAAITVSRFLAQNAARLGTGTVQWFISLALALYLAFFMLRDGERLVALLVRALPLGDARERLLFAKFAEVTRATVKGNLVVAAVQGALGGLIFWLLGIGGAVLWGAVMTLLSLIPLLGAGLIWAPVAIYLFATGGWVQGAILVVFGVAVIGLVDNILRPILVGRDTKLPDFMVLLSTLGGFAVFGINGFVIGPLLAALFVASWQIFIREFNPAPAPAAEAESESGDTP